MSSALPLIEVSVYKAFDNVDVRGCPILSYLLKFHCTDIDDVRGCPMLPHLLKFHCTVLLISMI